MRTAIDTNILSALWAGEESSDKIRKTLNVASEHGGLVVCGLVYAELRAFPRATAAFVDTFLEHTGVVVDWKCDKDIWQLAAERYEQYATRKRKQRMGEPKRFLADFIVGAHAMLFADRLITLDQRAYRKDFPEIVLGL